MLLSQFYYVNKQIALGITLMPAALPTYYMYDTDNWYTHIEHDRPEDTAAFTEIEPPQFEPGKTRPKFNAELSQWTVQPYTK